MLVWVIKRCGFGLDVILVMGRLLVGCVRGLMWRLGVMWDGNEPDLWGWGSWNDSNGVAVVGVRLRCGLS